MALNSSFKDAAKGEEHIELRPTAMGVLTRISGPGCWHGYDQDMNKLLLTATAILSLTAISACGNVHISPQTSSGAVTGSDNQTESKAPTTTARSAGTTTDARVTQGTKNQKVGISQLKAKEHKPTAENTHANQQPKQQPRDTPGKSATPPVTKKPKLPKQQQPAKSPKPALKVPVGDTKTKKSPGYGGGDGTADAQVSKISKTQTPWGEQWAFTLTTMKGVSYKAGYVSNESLSDGDPAVAKKFRGKHVFELELRGISMPDAKDIDDTSPGTPMPKNGGLTLVNSGSLMCGVETTQLGFAKKHKFTLSKSSKQKNTIIIQVIK